MAILSGEPNDVVLRKAISEITTHYIRKLAGEQIRARGDAS